MNNFEKMMVAVLVAALVLWMYLTKTFSPVPVQPVVPVAVQGGSNVNVTAQTGTNAPSQPVIADAASVKKEEPQTEPVVEPGEGHNVPEEFVTLSNSNAEVKLSSWGGVVTSVTLKKFRETIDKNSGPVKLDFSSHPALTFAGVPGLSRNCDFKMTKDDTLQKVYFERTLPSGIEFTRTITLGDGYQLKVADTFKNPSAVAVKLPACEIRTGPMQKIKGASSSMGYETLGIDTLPSEADAQVIFWGKSGPAPDNVPADKKDKKYSLTELFQPDFRGGGGCSPVKSALTQPLPVTTNIVKTMKTDWVAVKNKYFVQILAPKGGSSRIILTAKREVPVTENPAISQTWVQPATLEEVSAAMHFSEREISPGESVCSETSYFAGPKEYSKLKLLGNKQDKIMDFGRWFYPISQVLLMGLNFLYMVIPNYGVAIILLTLIVRIIFWPVTHKSTESMKEMQKLQPLVNQVREKYKDKPQKMNQEVMALYKEHKVNPLSGCLPILVQIPVFIALFTVLQSAVELRFSGFLWIMDLSEPENLLPGIFPFGGLNLLPLAMAATMFWQQKMTPTAGDPNQQKMMLYLMPGMMLFMFYKMASGLVLYWTISQVLSIYQLYRQKGKAEKEEKAAHAVR